MREVEEVKDPQPVKVEEPVAVEDVVVIILVHFEFGFNSKGDRCFSKKRQINVKAASCVKATKK